ncbi:hypothetical protein L208DRAFT_1414650 [Tricholoma matsutake]|nr:hypothetical protein L208DRAFT_1414650 [Tricholoma matsutake 945]
MPKPKDTAGAKKPPTRTRTKTSKALKEAENASAIRAFLREHFVVEPWAGDKVEII